MPPKGGAHRFRFPATALNPGTGPFSDRAPPGEGGAVLGRADGEPAADVVGL